jgi:ubiquinone/menaquinone biosynthesis C-methylase UbiE
MNCDPIAPYYAAMEFTVFGRTLERCRFAFLPELTGARRALVLGDGDGRFLTRLLSACPTLQADYVDCSAAMLAKAKRTAGDERVTYHHLNALTDPLPQASYDLVTSHFFLDCFDAAQQHEIVNRIAAAAPHARWLISEFRVPKGPLARPARAMIGLMYRFFSLATGLKTRALADHHPFLKTAGFRLAATAPHARGFIVSELWTREPIQ